MASFWVGWDELTKVSLQLDVTRVALERMREQSPPGGVIQQVTSVGGQRG